MLLLLTRALSDNDHAWRGRKPLRLLKDKMRKSILLLTSEVKLEKGMIIKLNQVESKCRATKLASSEFKVDHIVNAIAIAVQSLLHAMVLPS